jgi:hypothetical protein
MTILDHPTRNGSSHGARARNQSGRAISHVDLVDLIRGIREEARRRGERIPGRPALAEAIGVKPHRVRAALEELGREQHRVRSNELARGRAEHAQPNAAVNMAKVPTGASNDMTSASHDLAGSVGGPSGACIDANQRAVELPATTSTTQDRVLGEAAATGQFEAARSASASGAPVGALGFYVVAAMSLLVSMNTSWRFFENNLHITDLAERSVMFTVLEAALVACGWGMRANVRKTGRPGAPRLFAWLLCGMSGYMALLLSGPAAGIARVALGPALGLVMLHLALGIEIKARHARTTTWVRVGRELRERVLSRLGLADDERDALARTRQRAAERVAKLSLGTIAWFRTTRVRRALRASNAAHNPAAQDWLLAELAAARHAADLPTLSLPSPWEQALARAAALAGTCRPT